MSKRSWRINSATAVHVWVCVLSVGSVRAGSECESKSCHAMAQLLLQLLRSPLVLLLLLLDLINAVQARG
jgi:hypothetical protein